MTTFKGFTRSAIATMGRIERASQRAARESARQYKLQQKEEMLANAAESVKQYDKYIKVLQSVHKDTGEKIDWNTIKSRVAPVEPQPSNHHELLAKKAQQYYKPGLFDKMFGLTQSRIKKLEAKVGKAKVKDKNIYDQSVKQYQEARTDWEYWQKLSAGVINNELECYKEAIEYYEPFNDIKELGSRLSMTFEKEYVTIDLHVNNEEIIPKYNLSLTSTGKLSKKDMPVSKFNGLYQDYICSCVLRIARETFSILPVKFVIVNAVSQLVNTSSGQLEDQAILSVAIYPETLSKLNFESIDPSDSMKNFVHEMKYSKLNGFGQVQKLDASKLAR